jgi:hypothetical protein
MPIQHKHEFDGVVHALISILPLSYKIQIPNTLLGLVIVRVPTKLLLASSNKYNG